MRFLVIEDNQQDFVNIKDCLSQIGSSTHTRAKCYNEAHDIIQTDKDFDIIILDINLPNSRGLDLFVRVAELTLAPIVVITSIEDEELARQVVRAGAYGYVRKEGLTANDLYRAILLAKKHFDKAIGLIQENMHLKSTTRVLSDKISSDSRLENKIEKGFNNIHKKLDSIGNRTTASEVKIDNLENCTKELPEKVSTIESNVFNIREMINKGHPCKFADKIAILSTRQKIMLAIMSAIGVALLTALVSYLCGANLGIFK